jgi:CDP-diacylglycerol--glycerol-3-phosphate 3-phosphatidyltransferase
MCHPWLAVGVTGLLVVKAAQELRVILARESAEESLVNAGLLGARLRAWFRGRIEPLADALLAAGMTADRVTVSQVLVSVLCGLLYGAGWIFTAGCVLIASGTLDVLDGAMARKTGPTTSRGAFFDSVVDRYGEGAVFIGLAMFYRESPMLWAVLVAAFGSFMVSYTRARAEALGVACSVGLMQRPERYVLLGAGSVLGVLFAHLVCQPGRAAGLLSLSVLLVAILANVTALQRAAFTLRRLA